MRRILFILLLFFMGLAKADESNRIEWEELVPESLRSRALEIEESIFKFNPDHSSQPKAGSFSQFSMNETRPELNGKQVKITGFVVPLEFDMTYVNEFLLAPYMGACIHVPPPPANQIILVKSQKKVKIDDIYYPITFNGELTIEASETSLAETAYSLKATDFKVEKTEEFFGEEVEEEIFLE